MPLLAGVLLDNTSRSVDFPAPEGPMTGSVVVRDKEKYQRCESMYLQAVGLIGLHHRHLEE